MTIKAITPQERLIGVDELAARLGVKPSWVYGSVCTGRIPVVKVGRYNRFVYGDVLGALLDESARAARAR